MIIYEHEFRKYWQIKPTLTVWKLIESINTFVTLVARNVWITVTFSRFIITCIIYWSKRITSTVWKDKTINIFFVEEFIVRYIEEVILKAKNECYAKDKVKSLPFFDHWRFLVIFLTTNFMSFTKLKFRRSF